MASTYSSRLRIELIGTGEQSGTWGNTTNTNLGTLIEESIAGVASITMSDANYTLTTANGATDQSRQAVLLLTGTLTATRNVICPSVQKIYLVDNATSGGQDIVIKTSAGTGVTVANGKTALVYCDGTNVYPGSDSIAAGSVISGSTTDAALRITQTGTGNALVVEDSANPDATPFVINADGRALFGTTSYIDAWNTSQNIIAAGTGNPGLTVAQASNSTSTGLLNFAKSRGTTPGDWTTIVNSGDNLGQINFLGADGTTRVIAAAITGEVDGTPGTSDMPGRLVFSTTADGASTSTERVRIRADGGISTGGVAGSAATQFSQNGTLVSSSNVTRGFAALGTAPTTSTTEITGFLSAISTADAITGVTSYIGFSATQGTITGGTRVAPTSQYGFLANSTLTGATNNYGFHSNIASGTGRWNFYAAGTAKNYFAGNTGFGTTAPDAGLSVSTVASFGDGTALLPSIAHFGDLNTGFWFPAADTVALSTAGTERFRADSSGNINIATSGKAQKLYVNGNSASVISALTDGATITPDFSLANNFSVTLAGNRTLANPTNLEPGQSGVIFISQDATGSRTLGFGTYWDWPNSTAPSLTTTANAVDVLVYTVRSSTSIAAQLITNIG